jgi:DNA invertase Pin-like site-specific DNA recombinase
MNPTKIGYMRVSTADQDLGLQRDALIAAGCEKIYEDVISGAATERPGLKDALEIWLRLSGSSRPARSVSAH